MAFGTNTLYGHGFTVEGVPSYLDETCKAAPHGVFKGKAAAVRFADREAIALSGVTGGVHMVTNGVREYRHVQQVEGVVAAQLEGFGDLWFAVYIYGDEQAAASKSHNEFRAECDARAVARKSQEA